MKRMFLAVALLLPAAVFADSITQVENYILERSVLPLEGKTPWELADNLLTAQRIADLEQPDSLLLSENAVLRAITLESENPWDYKYCDEWNCIIMWSQSKIAINDLAHITLTPPVLRFPPTPVIPTPEPSELFMVASGLSLVVGAILAKRRK